MSQPADEAVSFLKNNFIYSRLQVREEADCQSVGGASAFGRGERAIYFIVVFITSKEANELMNDEVIRSWKFQVISAGNFR